MYLSLSELMISLSVLLRASCAVHVSGTGPCVYPLTFLQSISSSLAVNDILVASNTNRASEHVSIFRNHAKSRGKLFGPRFNTCGIVVVVRINAISPRQNRSVLKLQETDKPKEKKFVKKPTKSINVPAVNTLSLQQTFCPSHQRSDGA